MGTKSAGSGLEGAVQSTMAALEQTLQLVQIAETKRKQDMQHAIAVARGALEHVGMLLSSEQFVLSPWATTFFQQGAALAPEVGRCPEMLPGSLRVVVERKDDIAYGLTVAEAAPSVVLEKDPVTGAADPSSCDPLESGSGQGAVALTLPLTPPACPLDELASLPESKQEDDQVCDWCSLLFTAASLQLGSPHASAVRARWRRTTRRSRGSRPRSGSRSSARCSVS